MSTTVETKTATSDTAQRGAADGRSFVRNPLGGGSATFATAGTSTSAPASDEQPEGWWDKIKKFFSTFKDSGGVGSTIGGLLGLGGAWFAGNFFGGGIISTILTVALAIPMMLIGSDGIGGWINDWLGNSKGAAPAVGNSPAPAPKVAQNKAAQQTTAQNKTLAASTAGLTLTNEELVAMVGPQNGQPDNNRRDRVNIFVDPADPTRRLQVLPVDDSVPDSDNIITLSALRDKVGSQTSGIVFGQALNGVASVQAAPMRNMPNSSTSQGRQ